jgi:hypothetical protein
MQLLCRVCEAGGGSVSCHVITGRIDRRGYDEGISLRSWGSPGVKEVVGPLVTEGSNRDE